MKFKKLVISGIYYKKIIGNKGTYVMDEDWDNLIILDACRFDAFENINEIPGKLEYRISRGACTNEFLKENFKNKTFLDTIYITANPLVDYHVKQSFLEVIPVWKNGWNEKNDTVLPETMVNYSLEINKKYPKKRLIIHFVQPHYPFIGKIGKEKIGKHEGLLSRNLFSAKGNVDHGVQEVWNMVRKGKIKKNVIWDAYNENLEIVLKHLKELLDKLKGKTVISSDHGNLFGEWILPFPVKEYGHPSGIYKKNLVKVPWHIIESEKRKEITICEKDKIKELLRQIKI